jgi:hypothetical protein
MHLNCNFQMKLRKIFVVRREIKKKRNPFFP